tara:strand:- start:1617 stop:2267 length:651 start_codon:yes stop_codon:yes gene_type:complete
VNIILFGPPGVGKGTQADNMVKNFNLRKISTGDLLRDEIKKNTDLSRKIKSKIDRGLLVSDKTISDLIVKILSKKKYFNRLIFDGYPRNLNQAKSLNLLVKKYNQKISCVLNLNIDKESIIKRILGRLVCTKCGLTFNKYFNPPQKEKYDCNLKYLKTRSDDNENTIKNRLKVYTKETLPILDYYTDQRILYKIDGTGKINQVYREICDIIGSLGT